MGANFKAGEIKKRPGIYDRHINAGTPEIAGAPNDVVAFTVQSDWGALNTVITVYDEKGVYEAFGNGDKTSTVNLLNLVLKSGTSPIRVVRIGSGGQKHKAITLNGKDTTDTEAVPAVTVTPKYVGTRPLSIIIRPKLGDDKTKECILYEDTKELEKLSFSTEGKQSVNLCTAGAKSQYLDFAKVTSAADKETVDDIELTAFADGTNPTVTNESYSDAFAKLEAANWRVLALDTAETEVHQLAHSYIQRIYNTGKKAFLVIGEPSTVLFDTRCEHAKAFNDFTTVYIGHVFTDTTGSTLEGVTAAARVAGMVAACPSNKSLTHEIISEAVDVGEALTNAQYEQAIDSGMITFAKSNSGSVWIECGITTLVNPQGDDDAGWKKIKRCKVRYEVFDRCDLTCEPFIGKINNDADGQATVKKAIQGVLNAMVAEHKIFDGATVALDTDNPPVGDSAWFVIVFTDIDTLEKIYLIYQTRYAAA